MATLKRSTSSNGAKLDVRQLIRSAKTEAQVTTSSKNRPVETNFLLGDLICATVTSTTNGQTQLVGKLRFIGNTEFSTGVWAGLELNEPTGKNDGTCQGKRYFTCKPSHGVFVRAISCKKMIEVESTTPSPNVCALSTDTIRSTISKDDNTRPVSERSIFTAKTIPLDVKKRTTTPTVMSSQSRENRLKCISPISKRKPSPPGQKNAFNIQTSQQPPTMSSISTSVFSVDAFEDNSNLNSIIQQLLESTSFRNKLVDVVAVDVNKRIHASKSPALTTQLSPSTSPLKSTPKEDSLQSSIDSPSLLKSLKEDHIRSQQSLFTFEKLLDSMNTSLVEMKSSVQQLETSQANLQATFVHSPEALNEASDFAAIELINTPIKSSSTINSTTQTDADRMTSSSVAIAKQHQEQLEQRDVTIFQLKSTIEIVAHMSRQAHDLALNERQNYEKQIEDLNKKIQMYEIEIAKKYAILK